MRSTPLNRASILAAAALSMAGFNAMATDAPTKAVPTRSAPGLAERLRRMTGGEYRPKSPRRRGPGWSFAHVKRMARKRKNVLRNRRAHRG